jgi:hypothetical protein
MKQTRRQRQGRRPAERQRLTNRNITTATFPTTERGLRRSTAILPTSYCNIPDNGTWPATIHCNPTYYLSDVPHVAPESFFFGIFGSAGYIVMFVVRTLGVLC